MKLKHIPGPYKVCRNSVVTAAPVNKGRIMLAEVVSLKGYDNRFLFASAPKLLSALHLVRIQMESDLNDGRILQEVDREARQLILNVVYKAIDESNGVK